MTGWPPSPALLIVAAVIVLFAVILNTASGGSPDTRSDTAAFVMCQDFVRDRLKSPSTAAFPTIREARVQSVGEQEWQVRSHVDAQNSFGAELRTEWSCDIEYLGDEEWRGRATLLE